MIAEMHREIHARSDAGGLPPGCRQPWRMRNRLRRARRSAYHQQVRLSARVSVHQGRGPVARKIVDTILPTTMVGSYPRPKWFTYQLLGKDVRVAFKHVDHAEAYADATQVSIRDQEAAGLDIVTDGQMYFDDYVGVIG